MPDCRTCFKKQIVVDNRAGGGGVIASDLAAKAPPDGYTLLMTYTQHTVNATLVAKLPYRTVDDYTPITQITEAALVLVVNPSTPVNTVREFIDWTRKFQRRTEFLARPATAAAVIWVASCTRR